MKQTYQVQSPVHLTLETSSGREGRFFEEEDEDDVGETDVMRWGCEELIGRKQHINSGV